MASGAAVLPRCRLRGQERQLRRGRCSSPAPVNTRGVRTPAYAAWDSLQEYAATNDAAVNQGEDAVHRDGAVPPPCTPCCGNLPRRCTRVAHHHETDHAAVPRKHNCKRLTAASRPLKNDCIPVDPFAQHPKPTQPGLQFRERAHIAVRRCSGIHNNPWLVLVFGLLASVLCVAAHPDYSARVLQHDT